LKWSQNNREMLLGSSRRSVCKQCIEQLHRLQVQNTKEIISYLNLFKVQKR
jgi:hypothetical protein